ncbi:MAG: BON domain-containing protein [Gemmatimonadaceae bacterium]|nr:BON domain-containing protein [Gemmatimonadaceae bacterium]
MGAMLFGALAGVAVGMLLADRGALSGLLSGLRRAAGSRPSDRSARRDRPADRVRPLRTERAPRRPPNDEAELEARVLETFRNDPILVDRPIDIGAIGTGIIELTGWVDAASEIRHATTLTRGTIGVNTVVNRLIVRGSTPAA